MSKFPAGGPRQPVYEFLRSHGFRMAASGDKNWTRADGISLSLFGAGSMVCIYDMHHSFLTECPLEDAVKALATKPRKAT